VRVCQVLSRFPYREQTEFGGTLSGYAVGGVERHAWHLATELVALGDDVTVITTAARDDSRLSEMGAGISVIRLPSGPRLYSASLPLGVAGALKKEKFDIIHAHTPVPAIADLAAIGNGRRLPFLLTYHNDIHRGGLVGRIAADLYRRTLGRVLLSRCDAIIATTVGYAARSSQLRGYMDRVRVIPNAVDCAVFRPGIDAEVVRRKHGLSRDDRVVLFVGALEAYKGIDYLLRAFALVAGQVPGARLLLVGAGSQNEKLAGLAAELGIARRTIFAGYAADDELPLYYNSATMFVLPSVSCLEGFGIVQLEAMACGVPVITTSLPGPAEVDRHGVATIQVPPRDGAALSVAMKRLLTQRETASAMGAAGRQLALSRYSWPAVAAEVHCLYETLLKEHARRRR